MKQTRLMSLAEAISNVVVGYGIAVATQLVVFPCFGLPAHLDDALAIGGIFTVVSIARSFALRRLFEALRMRRGSVSEWARAEPGLPHKAAIRSRRRKMRADSA